MNSQELLESVMTALRNDAAMTALLAAGTGTDKVRYSRSLTEDADPVLAVDPSPSIQSGNVPGSFITVIGFDAFAKAEERPGATVADPMLTVAAIGRRVKEIFTRPRACEIPKGVMESLDLPELVPLQQGDFWRSSVRISFAHCF